MRVVHTSRARVDAMVLLSLAKHVRNTRAAVQRQESKQKPAISVNDVTSHSL